MCNSTTENLSYWDFLDFVDIHYIENYKHENIKNQQ